MAEATAPAAPSDTGAPSALASPFVKPFGPRKRRRSVVTSVTPSSLPLKALSPGQYTAIPLTGMAALEGDKKRRGVPEKAQSNQQSSNPGRDAIGALLGSQSRSMSRVQDAPNAATTLSEPIAEVASELRVQKQNFDDSCMNTSPVSMSSLGTLESTAGGVSIIGNGVNVASPCHSAEDVNDEEDESAEHSGIMAGSTLQDEGHSNKALTFPGRLTAAQIDDARRNMSLPHSGLSRSDSRSPSGPKKHKCPFCSTEFTRHHNLKSHLLTHSQEKPYLCRTCDSRFRRLHDLKRHTKLHTGEKPHICPKCDRSFARGDALARHAKGQGGCAGRRSSMGSFDEKGGPGGETMEGVMYTDEPENMEDDEAENAPGRPRGLPSIKQHDAPPDILNQQFSETAHQSRQPRTYPPVAARPPHQGGLYPPAAAHGSSSNAPGTSGSAFQVGGQNIFSPGSMTESPKPLSPAGTASHPPAHAESGLQHSRNPSLTQHLQQQQYGRRANTHNPSPSSGLHPPPMSASSHSHIPHLPSLPGLAPPDPRFTLSSSGPPQGSTYPGPSPVSGSGITPGYQPHQGAVSSAGNSHSSHGTTHASGEGLNNLYPQGNDRLWAYVQSLEVKINRLQGEVTALQGQLRNEHHR